MKYEICKSKKEDCKQIAEFITIVWNQTYKGIVNDKFLEKLKENEEKRYKKSEENFDEENNMQYIVKNEANKIIGFLKLSKINNNEILEVQSLYILKEFQKKGLGRKLLEFAFEKAKKLKYKKLIIGCLEQNPSNEFYIKIGGKFVGKRKFELPGQVLYENVYEYDL